MFAMFYHSSMLNKGTEALQNYFFPIITSFSAGLIIQGSFLKIA